VLKDINPSIDHIKNLHIGLKDLINRC